jgi:hypothetical protein
LDANMVEFPTPCSRLFKTVVEFVPLFHLATTLDHGPPGYRRDRSRELFADNWRESITVALRLIH